MLFNGKKEIVNNDTQKNLAKDDISFDEFNDILFGCLRNDKPAKSSQESSSHADLDPFFVPGNKARSYELQYVRDLKLNPQLRASDQGENTFIYQWNGNFWNRLSEIEGKRKAWEWLKKFAPKNAAAKTASSLYATSLLELPALPPIPKFSIIPLMDRWLVVSEDGSFQIKQPDMTWGVTYQINAALELEKDVSTYQPAPLPAHSNFSRFLTLSLPNEEERMLVQEYCGYTLLNDVRFQVAQVWVGDGCNGKSVLLKIIEKLHAKVGSIRLDQLSGFGLAPLVDSSLIICSEAPKRGIDEQAFKQIISGDAVSIEYKFKDMFMYNPLAKMLIACNRFPHFSDDSNGIWRRLQIIRWGVNIEKKQQVANLDRLIIDNELKLVVDWCLEGLSRLLQRGDFNEPASVRQRKDTEKINSNNVLAFVEDYGLVLDSTGASLLKEKVYEKYAEYCAANGLSAYHGTEFWKRMLQNFPAMTEQRKTIRKSRPRAVNLSFGETHATATIVDDNPFGEE